MVKDKCSPSRCVCVVSKDASFIRPISDIGLMCTQELEADGDRHVSLLYPFSSNGLASNDVYTLKTDLDDTNFCSVADALYMDSMLSVYHNAFGRKIRISISVPSDTGPYCSGRTVSRRKNVNCVDVYFYKDQINLIKFSVDEKLVYTKYDGINLNYMCTVSYVLVSGACICVNVYLDSSSDFDMKKFKEKHSNDMHDLLDCICFEIDNMTFINMDNTYFIGIDTDASEIRINEHMLFSDGNNIRKIMSDPEMCLSTPSEYVCFDKYDTVYYLRSEFMRIGKITASDAFRQLVELLCVEYHQPTLKYSVCIENDYSLQLELFS